jgi:tRNA dimethylallyltransferase
MNKKQKLVVIVGPTASGKSDLAVRIAKEINGEVISADSRQVYKGLNIGTGKITKREMRGVKHYLLDVADPKKVFTASNFKTLAEKAIEEILSRGKMPIICGGTGFYIDAVLGEKQIPEVPPDLKLRKELEKKTTEELFEILKKNDPERAGNIDSKNPRRLIRAIEIAQVLGKVPKIELRSMNYELCKIGIKIENEELRERIKKRIDKWFKQGLLKEVENLHKKGLSWKRMSEIGLEYRLAAQFLSKPGLGILGLKQKMAEKTWQYAKRQKTWFKKDKNIRWIPVKNLPTSSFIHLI